VAKVEAVALVALACSLVLSAPAAGEQTVLDTTYNLYVGNLHSHTSYSDGTGTPAQAFAYARDVAGIDFLAVTDHHHVLTVEEYEDILYQADVFTDDGVFIGIGGQEWTGIEMNHSTVWDAPRILTARLNDYDSLYREIRDLGVTAAFCHPKPYNFLYFAYSEVGDVGINAVEVRDSQEEQCYIDILRKGWHVGTDGSQDNHSANWGNGWSWTVALACSLTRHEILEATRNHRTYSTLDRDLAMIFRAEGHIMGEHFAHTDNIEFSVCVCDPEPGDVFTRLELYQNGLVIAWLDLDSTACTWAPAVTPPEGENNYFVKAYQKWEDRAWSAPVWIDCTTSLPSTPRLCRPYDGQTVISLTPDFIWHSSEKACGYTLRVSTSDTFPFDGDTFMISGITDTCCTLSDSLEDDVLYYWAVRADNEAGPSLYSGTYSFLTDEDASDAAGEGLRPPGDLSLGRISPNPFGERTVIEYSLGASCPVDLALYDIAGRRVSTLAGDTETAGDHRVYWDGTDDGGKRVSPGVYLCRLSAGGLSIVRKVVVLR
jgi:hypothetical protein